MLARQLAQEELTGISTHVPSAASGPGQELGDGPLTSLLWCLGLGFRVQGLLTLVPRSRCTVYGLGDRNVHLVRSF